ncbi:helix-hairpin-helix domain-containing protein [Hazenella sp. IB182357]|uniref:Helix-hairpin-helix domain-containing protein n=1 Tax=Polycladospora coralii TaxID=2771432 RepID=A0A926N926_9BACL|nr:helix-hairpin-helix domain-containing protein [Polycladospora coralii]MBD1371110.1 helix-hairpin-helix domain-containing protein [Polycladospora coralii]MBS7530052.1 helix-hairpin-helix domain-containing protein [Polycladospora coralii]
MFEMMWSTREKVLVSIIIILGVALGIVLWYPTQSDPPSNQSWQTYSEQDEEEVNQQKEEESNTIVIDVKGAVQEPGLVELEQGARVSDAIEQAGQLTEKADSNQINLAARLQDGEVVYVPQMGEEVSILVLPDKANTTVNLNRATIAELEQLTGIGQAKAEAIIQYRDENGSFTTIEEVMKVSGIGEKTFKQFKDEVSVK